MYKLKYFDNFIFEQNSFSEEKITTLINDEELKKTTEEIKNYIPNFVLEEIKYQTINLEKIKDKILNKVEYIKKLFAKFNNDIKKVVKFLFGKTNESLSDTIVVLLIAFWITILIIFLKKEIMSKDLKHLICTHFVLLGIPVMIMIGSIVFEVEKKNDFKIHTEVKKQYLSPYQKAVDIFDYEKQEDEKGDEKQEDEKGNEKDEDNKMNYLSSKE